MPPVIVDDRLLLSVLLRTEPPGVARIRRHGALYTTGLWYQRLCRALGGGRVAGQLSASLAEAPVPTAAAALASVIELPPTIGLLSLRDVAWSMGQVLRRHRLNLIGLEALCAAMRLGATICVGERNDGPTLRRAAHEVGVGIRAFGV
ncbi:MAG: hypothetical protein ACRDY7_12230 [Acidimicrobiia bacterium]